MINQNNWWEKSNSIKYWYIEYVIVLDYINKTKNANMLLRIYNFTLILSKLQIKSVIYSTCTCNLKIIYVKKGVIHWFETYRLERIGGMGIKHIQPNKWIILWVVTKQNI